MLVGMTEPELYDVEAALEQLRLRRRLGDELTCETERVAEKLSRNMARHFPSPREREVAGAALIVAVASLYVLVQGDVAAPVVLNVGAFAGENLLRGARGER